MSSNENEPIGHNPQYIVVSTLKSLILRLHEVVNDLLHQHEELEKKLESRYNNLSACLTENELQLKELKEHIDEIKLRVDAVEAKLDEVDEFFRETKVKISIWKKCLTFIKEAPGVIVTFFGAIAAIATFIVKYFGG